MDRYTDEAPAKRAARSGAGALCHGSSYPDMPKRLDAGSLRDSLLTATVTY